MPYSAHLEDTIAAISTPQGEGGIGIVRLSGPGVIAIASRLFVSSHGRCLTGPGRVFHGHAVDGEGAVLDEVLVHVMHAPHSYTREDVVEINAHGGSAALEAILEQALVLGARIAEPGEFTRRAFLNGRIDLVQAEAVIDCIRARTRAGLRAAAAAADGRLSQALHEIHAVLSEGLAHIEAAIDFPDEDLPDLVNESLFTRLSAVHNRMEALLATAEAGRLYREGARVVIVGRPNAGKSSLFNALLREARAIVTAVPGTTRDRIEEGMSLEGIPIRLMDTAGLRATDDEVERIGVDLARASARQADLVIWVVDGSEPVTEADEAIARELAGVDVPVLLAINKADLPEQVTRGDWETLWKRHVETALLGVFPVSAIQGAGLSVLEAAMAKTLLRDASAGPDAALITRAHQRDSLRRAASALKRTLDNFGASPDLLSLDLREALQAIGEITGETAPDDLLEIIFRSFCIGK